MSLWPSDFQRPFPKTPRRSEAFILCDLNKDCGSFQPEISRSLRKSILSAFARLAEKKVKIIQN
jgi:hypothetical protein